MFLKISFSLLLNELFIQIVYDNFLLVISKATLKHNINEDVRIAKFVFEVNRFESLMYGFKLN
jgi:hypothetical protein